MSKLSVFKLPFVISKELQIGTIIDKNSNKQTPIRLRDLTNMKNYNKMYEFKIAKEHESVTHIGISIHECIFKNDKMNEISTTILSPTMNSIALKFFMEKVWSIFSEDLNEDEFWKGFGYFMTDGIAKYISDWNMNNKYYWSAVAKQIYDFGVESVLNP